MNVGWRHCSICKKDIAHGSTYYECNVSTCNGKRTGLFFCSVECWSAHVPDMRHRDAWANEKTAPSADSIARPVPSAIPVARERRVVAAAAQAPSAEPAGSVELAAGPEHDVLIVVSKLKTYVKARSGMNTSDNVMPVLSDLVREACDRAIRRAAQDGRKTVMNRDFGRG